MQELDTCNQKVHKVLRCIKQFRNTSIQRIYLFGERQPDKLFKQVITIRFMYTDPKLLSKLYTTYTFKDNMLNKVDKSNVTELTVSKAATSRTKHFTNDMCCRPAILAILGMTSRNIPQQTVCLCTVNISIPT